MTKLKSVYKVILIFLIILSTTENSNALENITDLIYNYEEKVFTKEKEHFLGTYIVFHRRDIELLQLNKLSDVLKLIPLGNFSPDRLGINYWSFAGSYLPAVKFAIRLYLDEHELSSIDNGNPFVIYDDYPLDNIDKIEIYITPSSSQYSVENGVIIIKMFSKNASSEKASIFRAGFDRYGSNIYSTGINKTVGDLEFNLTFNVSDLNFPSVYIKDKALNKDQYRNHLYAKVRYKGSIIQLSFSQVSRNLFGGFSRDFSPDRALLKAEDRFFSYSQSFLKDKSMKFLISYDIQNRNYLEENFDTGIIIPIFGKKKIILLNKEKKLEKLASRFEKIFFVKNLFFFRFGINASYYRNNINIDNIQPSGLRINSYIKNAFFTSSYLDMIFRLSKILNTNLSYEIQRLEWDLLPTKYAHNYKFGISFNKNFFSSKIIYSQEYIIPPIGLLELIRKRNNRFSLIKYKNVMLENSVGKENLQVTFTVFKSNIKNSLMGLRLYGGTNHKSFTKQNITAGLIMLNGKHKNNFYTLSIWYIHRDNFRNLSPHSGSNFLIRGETKKIDYFFQVLYRKSYKVKQIKIQDGFDVSLGITLKLIKELFIKLKAENIFNSSTKAVFFSNKNTIIYNTTYRNFVLFLERYF